MAPGTNSPEVLASSDTMAPSGRSAPSAAADRLGGERRRSDGPGRAGLGRGDPSPVPRARSASASSGAGHVVGGPGHTVDLAAVGHEVAGLARVGEEGDRGRGVDQDQVADPVELRRGELGEVAEPLDGGQARRPASRRAGKVSHKSAGPGGRGQAGWPPRGRGAGRPAHR